MTELKIRPCPHCGKPALWENNPFKPFCCERCRLIDLGNWASERYRIPTQEDVSELLDDGEGAGSDDEGEGE